MIERECEENSGTNDDDNVPNTRNNELSDKEQNYVGEQRHQYDLMNNPTIERNLNFSIAKKYHHSYPLD